MNYVPTAPCDNGQDEHQNKPFPRLAPLDPVGTIRVKRPLTDAEFGETGFVLSFKNSEEDCSTHL